MTSRQYLVVPHSHLQEVLRAPFFAESWHSFLTPWPQLPQYHLRQEIPWLHTHSSTFFRGTSDFKRNSVCSKMKLYRTGRITVRNK